MRYSEMVAFEKERALRTRRSTTPSTVTLTRVRSWSQIAVMIVLALLLAGCASPEYRDRTVRMTTVGNVDLNRYAGRWYEIARFPNRFEEGCVGVTADYTLNADGSVKVVNTCRQGALDGPVEIAEGRAVAARPEADRLRVSFVEWLPFAAGDYWILDLDSEYDVAVIGNPSGTTGWVLARSPRLSQARLEQAFGVLQRNGYDTRLMTLTAQPDN